ncbi:MAG: hypothetical protein JWM74_859, partial [Myxococcaceae bacterium]|nr:hypothetical protein [Myxococcaceae bacterium]
WWRWKKGAWRNAYAPVVEVATPVTLPLAPVQELDRAS